MGSAMPGRDLDIDPKRVGRPRFDPYQRLLSRFHEQVFLLNALGQTRGDHTTPSYELDASRAQIRQFLQNLCHVCEFKKGGRACTAIGLEELDTCYRFCVASNTEIDKIAAFLNLALTALRTIANSAGTNYARKKSEFVQLCIGFAAERIKEENKCLRRCAKDCLAKLNGQNTVSNSELITWLETAIGFDDGLKLCNFAYNTRHSMHISELLSRGVQEESQLGLASKRSSFLLVRHYIGRLANHIRASRELIKDSKDLSHLLDYHEVCPVSSPPAVPPPIRDSHTNLRGILNPMPINAEEKAILKVGLLHLNKTARIFDTFLIQYSISTLEVHAEVQVLEYFYKTQRSFAGDDRFIACSKPACLCCEMYFRYHPARMVVPSSHCKIWTKWSPPLVEQYDNNNPAARQQKHILNKMTQNLCEQVITHVLQRFSPNRWHPDSITNITDLRRCGISSDSLEVSDAETPETTPSMFSQEHQIGSNDPTQGEQGSSGAEADFQAFDSENGGVSLFDYT